MDFRILGALEVLDGERRIDLSPRLRDLLAVLLCEHGGIVSVDRLVNALWGDGVPSDARRTLQVHVHRLRRALGDGTRIAHRPPGYALALRPDELDVDRFVALVEQARSDVATGDVEAGTERLRDALDLWRGSAFDGQHDLACVREEAARLSELHLRAVEDRFDVDLALGRHADIVGELRETVVENPFRERPRARLMLALYRLGRHAEALEVYREGRGRMVDELGVEPGAELRELEQAILAHDPTLDPPAPSRRTTGGEPVPRTVPAELPSDVPVLVGRVDELDTLRAVLTREFGPRIAVINGSGGVGKSALALHVAAELTDRFPDGRLYVNLHGSTAGMESVPPQLVLGRFLRALSEPATPPDVEEAAARFRSTTAGLRVLVVLDDAADAAQVRPLLPGGPGCAALVTSRRVPSTLDGAVHLALGPLSTDEAVALLGGVTGDGRTDDEPEAAAEIVRLCGGLPLAVRIAGARLVERRDWPLTMLARRLSHDRDRLDELRYDDLAVRTSLDGSLAGLSPEAARMFALLGVFDGPDLTESVAETLIDGVAEHALDRLAEARLIEPANGHYQVHDLVRLYAREPADALPEPERAAALRRVLHYYLASARRVAIVLDPRTTHRTTIGDEAQYPGVDPADSAEALQWIDAERENLLAAVRQAADLPEHGGVAVGLAAVLYRLLEMRGGHADQAVMARISLAAAERSGDARGIAQANSDFGDVHDRIGHLDEAVLHHHRSLDGWRTTGDRLGEAKALNNLGATYHAAGRFEESVDYYWRSVAVCEELGNRVGKTILLSNLGGVYLRLGRVDDAIATLWRSLALSEELGYARAAALAAGNLAEAHLRAGRPTEAVPLFERAVVDVRNAGDRLAEAEFLWYLAEALGGLDRAEEARQRRWQAIVILRDTGDIDDETAQKLRSDPNPEVPEVLRLQT